MKKLLVLFLLLLALSPLFGQPTPVIAGIDLGQGWIDPDNDMNELVPQSLLSFVTYGFYMDEIDTLVRAPLLFGTYEGYSIFSAYGNYEYWLQGVPAVPVNPFTPGTGLDVGSYQFGLAMPVPEIDGWRAGVLFGQDTAYTGGLTSGLFFDAESATTAVDVAADIGVVDYTTVETYEAKDLTTTADTKFVSALNMGFMGASLYLTVENNTRVLGGTYGFTRTDGTTTPPDTTPRTSSRTSYWGPSAIGDDLAGTKADGKVAPISDGRVISSGLAGQLEVLGMPVTAGLNVTFTNEASIASLFGGNDFDTLVPVRSSRKTTYAVDGVADKVSTYEILEGVNLSAAWDASTAYALPGAATPANYSTSGLLDLAIDPKNSSNSGFYTGLNLAADPSFELAENVVLTPRAALMYNIGFLNQNITGVAYGAYSEAQTGVDVANVSWTYAETTKYSYDGTVHELLSNLGAALRLNSPEEKVSLTSGFYLAPYLYSLISKEKGSETTIDRTYVDAAGTPVDPAAMDAAATKAAAAALIGTNTGSSRYSSVTVSDKTEVDTASGLRMSVPLAVKVNFFKNKLSFVGGVKAVYDARLFHSRTNDASSTTTETVTVQDAAGAAVNFTTPPVDSAASTMPQTEETKEWTVTPWAGEVNFMLRFQPNETVTVDIEGHSFETALADLDDLLSLNDGINISSVWDFLQDLAISVNFHF